MRILLAGKFGRRFASLVLLLTAIASFSLNFSSVRLLYHDSLDWIRQWNGVPPRGTRLIADLPRQMVERYLPVSTNLYYVGIAGETLRPFERSTCLAISWPLLPSGLRFGRARHTNRADMVLTCASVPDYSLTDEGFPLDGYSQVDRTEWNVLWCRNEKLQEVNALRQKGMRKSAEPLQWWREAIGLSFVVLLFLVGWIVGSFLGVLLFVYLFSIVWFCLFQAGWWSAPISLIVAFVVALGLLLCAVNCRSRMYGSRDLGEKGRKCWHLWIVGGLVMLATTVLALSHPYMTPNGLGVVGGRAKLMWLLGRYPVSGFPMEDWELYQSAYPLGHVLLILACYVVGGGCGDWLMQLTGCLFSALLSIWVCRQVRGGCVILWFISLLTTSLWLVMGSQLYSEPLMLLFALVGIDYVVHRRGYNLIGWVLIGASGWIKNEGLLILIASWIGVRVVYGRKLATLKALLLAGLIPVCWHVAVRVCGAKLFDYANPWQVDWTRGIKAFLYTLNYFFLSPWESGFVAYLFCFLLAMGLLRLRKLRKRKEMCFTALVSGILMFVYFYVFSVSRAQDFDWHLESALPRLLCFPILLLARSVVNELDASDRDD